MFTYINANDIKCIMRGPYKKRNVIIIGVAALIAGVITVALILEGMNSTENQGIKILSDNVDLRVRDVIYSDVGDSGLKWEIRADTARYLKNERIALFDKVTIKVILKDGNAYVMTGTNGRVNLDSKDMEIEGNVKIGSDFGDNLTTDILKYSGAEMKFHTNSPVVMKNRRMEVKGTGLSISLKDETLSLLSKVRARADQHGK
jgi:LPS export ABC transporter protein LptC